MAAPTLKGISILCLLMFKYPNHLAVDHYYHVVLSSLIANMPLFLQQLRFLFFVFCPYLPLYNSYYSRRADEVSQSSGLSNPASPI